MTRVLLLCLSLGACSSYADRVAITCAQLGAPRGSDAYWPCVHQQVAVDQRDRAAWAGVTVAGAGMLAPRSTIYLIEE